ncbi:MAG: MOSC domain-containing protein [Symploca sp. SIO3E6]|nr:MOSC domain-containing protein [Caldora sp. SIO3E6]
MPYISQILIYPIKSLDSIAVNKAKVLASGALEHDRQFAIVDEQGKFVNGKRNPKIHLLRTSFNLEAQTISLQANQTEEPAVFHLQQERGELETWLSGYFGKKVRLQENLVQGFPDDTNANGPTLISTATIATAADWFTGISSEQMRQRLRANVEITDVPPFWEDRLFGETGNIVEFQIGSIRFEGINPCARCIVPTRDPLTGQAYPDFQKIFVTQRQASLPSWASSSRFNHFYRLSVNTCIPDSEAGKVLQVGDEVILD